MKSGLIKMGVALVIAVPLLAINNNNYHVNVEAAPKKDEVSVATATHEDFSEGTRAIIQDQWENENINEHNYDEVMAKYGGYDNWLLHLGGVFAKYAGEDTIIEIKTAEDLQIAAEYTWGLMTIFGFDYMSTDEKFHKWGASNKEVEPYAFYTNPNRGWLNHMYDDVPIDRICSKKATKEGKWIGMRTNCNCGVGSYIKKTSLYRDYGDKAGATPKSSRQLVSDSELQVGYLVHFYGHTNEPGDIKWHHVAIVGEIDYETGEKIMYDSGNRFVRTGKFKKKLSKDYGSYRAHHGERICNIDQTTCLGTEAGETTQTPTSYTPIPSSDTPLDTSPGFRNEWYNGTHYYISVPDNPTEAMPLVVFLHGSGENSSFKKLGGITPVKYVKKKEPYKIGKYVFIAPHSSDGSWGERSTQKRTMELIEKIANDYKIDKNRIILTGMSRGAMGVWSFVRHYPNYFAGIVPVSNGAQDKEHVEPFLNLPIFAMVGTEKSDKNDEPKIKQKMEEIINSINEKSGKKLARLIIIEGETHGGAQNKGFVRRDLYEWMLAQRKS